MKTLTPSSQNLPFILLLSLFLILTSSSQIGIQIDLTHVDAASNFTMQQLIHRAVERSKHRASLLTTKTSTSLKNIQAPLHGSNGEYLIELAIGKPPVPFVAILDTGSDLIWTQCKPCKECYKQPTPLFDPSKSSTFAKLPCTSGFCKALVTQTCVNACEYYFSYGENPLTSGILATETLTFGSSSFPSIAFGCGTDNTWNGPHPASGYIGLGRGTLSLTSQLGLKEFSYCFTPVGDSKKSRLVLGSSANLNRTLKAALQTTPLLQNPNKPSFYYLNLLSVTVGTTKIRVQGSKSKTSENLVGAMLIDSETSVTSLEKEIYYLVKDAFKAQMQLPFIERDGGVLDLCFKADGCLSLDNVEVPKLAFHFEGGDMDFPVTSYMTLDSESSELCAMILWEYKTSIMGNYMLQNIHMLYDLEKEKLSFVKAECSQL